MKMITAEPAPTGSALLSQAMAVLRAGQDRAETTITLIPAENSLWPPVRLPMLADLAGRYMFENDPDPQAGDWNFPAARASAWLETGLAVPLLRRLADAPFVNVRPLSGLHAMQMVVAALGGIPGSGTVACLSADQGGHYATAGIVTRLGHRVVQLPGTGQHGPDLEQVADLCAEHRPALVYLDQCHALNPFDTAPIAAAVRSSSPATKVHVDISHTLGLVLGGAVANPLDGGADSISASTHKSFPGPQKGVIATRDADLHQRFALVQPQFVSNHHFGAVAALGLALAAFADQAGSYAQTAVTNAQTLGKHLAHAGWDMHGAEYGYTRTHQLWAEVPGVARQIAAGRLYDAGVNVNWLTDLPVTRMGLRLGLAEAAWIGLRPADMADLSAIMAAAVTGERPAGELAHATAALRRRVPAYPFTPVLDPRTAGDAAAVLGSVTAEFAR
ncbi:hypothetical protein ACEZDB_32470 [Streptacidiphilus sp. N1-3]|uniref:Serine hydroxymethyltransferase-like domain-containing protein n=1 Tax=Streptacidiphilus alkalitolerans TaxID=3342712 RepID=A0ABV6XAU7_9ACTN